jgi:hypothetical protein
MSRLAVTVAVGLPCAVVGYLLSEIQPSVELGLVCATALTCAVPIVARLCRRRLDLFEPLVIANLALVVMYVGRPGAIIASGADDVFKGYDISAHVRQALIITLIGSAFLQVGYALPWARRTAARLSPPRGRWNVEITVAFSIALVVLAFALFGAFLLQSGGLAVLSGMLKGRSLQQDAYFRDSSAYLYSAPALLWPASLLLFALGLAERRKGFVVAGLLLMIPLGLLAGSQGSRITLIPLLLSPAIYYYLARQRRPRLLALLVVGYLVFTVGIAYFRETRTATERVDRVHELKRSIADPGFEYSQLFLHGTDNDMFESLAVETTVVPSKLSASPFDFLYRTAAKPIPSRIWKGKPLAPEERLTRTLFPQEQSRASSSPGVVGSFYLMGLLPGVIVGMVLVGYVFRVPWEYWRLYPSESVSQLFLTASLMFIPILLRGSVGDTFARALFGLGPLLVASRLCRLADASPSPIPLRPAPVNS